MARVTSRGGAASLARKAKARRQKREDKSAKGQVRANQKREATIARKSTTKDSNQSLL